MKRKRISHRIECSYKRCSEKPLDNSYFCYHHDDKVKYESRFYIFLSKKSDIILPFDIIAKILLYNAPVPKQIDFSKDYIHLNDKKKIFRYICLLLSIIKEVPIEINNIVNDLYIFIYINERFNCTRLKCHIREIYNKYDDDDRKDFKNQYIETIKYYYKLRIKMNRIAFKSHEINKEIINKNFDYLKGKNDKEEEDSQLYSD